MRLNLYFIGAPGEPTQSGLEVEPQPSKRMVQQVFFEFYHKPTKPKRTILASAANPWQQKRTTLTQECIRRLRNTRKDIACHRKQEILTEYMQMLKNSGYSVNFRREILLSGINGYNKILEADRNKSKPLYRTKGWKSSARRMDSKKKSQNWLGPSFKSCIFVPPTPGSELKKLLQQKEEEMRPGGREEWPIKIIETYGKSLERFIVKTDPFNGNQCLDKKCLPAQNKNNKISCCRNNIGYRIPCKICIKEGKKWYLYWWNRGKYAHLSLCHLTKFNSKQPHIRESSAFFKHLQNTYGGLKECQDFADCFFVEIVKAYQKPMTRQTEEGTFMINTVGELLN